MIAASSTVAASGKMLFVFLPSGRNCFAPDDLSPSVRFCSPTAFFSFSADIFFHCSRPFSRLAGRTRLSLYDFSVRMSIAFKYSREIFPPRKAPPRFPSVICKKRAERKKFRSAVGAFLCFTGFAGNYAFFLFSAIAIAAAETSAAKMPPTTVDLQPPFFSSRFG